MKQPSLMCFVRNRRCFNQRTKQTNWSKKLEPFNGLAYRRHHYKSLDSKRSLKGKCSKAIVFITYMYKREKRSKQPFSMQSKPFKISSLTYGLCVATRATH